jgi:site-specific recombinase XerD
MLERYFRSRRVRRRIQENLIGGDIEHFVEYLDGRGHSPFTIQTYVQAAEHFGGWLATRKGRHRRVNYDTVHTFLEEHLPECRCSVPAPRYVRNTRPALRHLLRSAGKPVFPSRSKPMDTVTEQLLHDYANHLEMNCGLALETRHYRLRHAREFLASRFPRGRIQLSRLKPEDTVRFVTDIAARCQRSTAQQAACSVRSLLRFLRMNGLCGEGLVRAVPWVPHWRLANLPESMAEEQLRRILDSFNRSTATGRRDYSMALCMVDLALRVSEVVEIDLEDIDWRNGVVRIGSMKERQTRQLPLPRRLGEAIAAYLKDGRPNSSSRRVFLRHRAPMGRPVSRQLVRGVMRRAYERCGYSQWTGTHILRHTAATRLHQQGATLKEIADLLGHQSIDTSKVYAKVNLPMLRSVALPWPEVRS